MREQIENNQNYNFNGIPEYAKELEGTTIYTSNVGDNMRLITDSIEAAKSYEWLYHCTNSKAFLSILKNREFWFSNLNNVNDKDEVARIDDKAYEKAFYIGSFTYNDNIPDEHWKEYANENGVLIGVKKHWFKRHAVFMNTKNDKELSDRFFKIYNNQSTAESQIIKVRRKGRVINPFYISEFDFCKIKYDDSLYPQILGNARMRLLGNECELKTKTKEVAGIVKRRQGSCEREGKETYIKNWESEREVRLKICIHQYIYELNGKKEHDDMIVKCVHTFHYIYRLLCSDVYRLVAIAAAASFGDGPVAPVNG